VLGGDLRAPDACACLLESDGFVQVQLYEVCVPGASVCVPDAGICVPGKGLCVSGAFVCAPVLMYCMIARCTCVCAPVAGVYARCGCICARFRGGGDAPSSYVCVSGACVGIRKPQVFVWQGAGVCVLGTSVCILSAGIFVPGATSGAKFQGMLGEGVRRGLGDDTYSTYSTVLFMLRCTYRPLLIKQSN
jgi:hypothetical protein